MARRVIVDSGPLVALLNRRDVNHAWAKQEVAEISGPLLTCEAVISEVFFLLSRVQNGSSTFSAFLRDELAIVPGNFSYREQAQEILRHVARYSNVPMSFADACLVRMSEFERDSFVFTTDRDFLTYRRNVRQPIPLISPF